MALLTNQQLTNSVGLSVPTNQQFLTHFLAYLSKALDTFTSKATTADLSQHQQTYILNLNYRGYPELLDMTNRQFYQVQSKPKKFSLSYFLEG